jgi:hypothetical protein
MAITIIYKGDGWASKTRGSSSKSFSIPRMDPEQALHERIEKGSVTDSDISTIKKTGGKLMKHLLTRENEQGKKIKDMKRQYGNTFDGIDNDGNFYKDIPLDKIEKE